MRSKTVHIVFAIYAASWTAFTRASGRPVNNEIRPPIQLAGCEFQPAQPLNEQVDVRSVRIATMPLRLVGYRKEKTGEAYGPAAEVVEVSGDQDVPASQVRLDIERPMDALALDRYAA